MYEGTASASNILAFTERPTVSYSDRTSLLVGRFAQCECLSDDLRLRPGSIRKAVHFIEETNQVGRNCGCGMVEKPLVFDMHDTNTKQVPV